MFYRLPVYMYMRYVVEWTAWGRWMFEKVDHLWRALIFGFVFLGLQTLATTALIDPVTRGSSLFLPKIIAWYTSFPAHPT